MRLNFYSFRRHYRQYRLRRRARKLAAYQVISGGPSVDKSETGSPKQNSQAPPVDNSSNSAPLAEKNDLLSSRPPQETTPQLSVITAYLPGKDVFELAEVMKHTECFRLIDKHPLPHPDNHTVPNWEWRVTGFDMGLTSLDACCSIDMIRESCNHDVVPLLAMGLCTPIDVYDDISVDNLAEEVENNSHVPLVDFDDIFERKVYGIAISYKHGLHCKLSKQRLRQGLVALRWFVKPGMKVSIWVDSVYRKSEIAAAKVDPSILDKSWMSHGLLPYHLFPVICLGNRDSERVEKEWRQSFWLNLEGVMGCLGSGLIFCNYDVLDASVDSWHIYDGDECMKVAQNDLQGFCGFKRGNQMATPYALTHLLKIAVEGGFSNTIATFQEDLFQMEEMAAFMMLIGSWTEFGDVIFRGERRASLSRHDIPYANQHSIIEGGIRSAIKRRSYSFNKLPGNEDTLNEVLISKQIKKWRGILEWTPTDIDFFQFQFDNPEIIELWVILYSEEGDTAIGVCLSEGPTRNRAHSFPYKYASATSLKYQKVLVLELQKTKLFSQRKVVCKKVVWNKFVPGLLRCIVNATDSAQQEPEEVQKWVGGMINFARMARVPVGLDVAVAFHTHMDSNWI